MTGFIVDPFSNAGYLTLVAGANDGNGGGGVTAPGQDVVPVVAYAVTNNGTISPQFYPFENWSDANGVAQDQSTGLDADNGSWGVQAVNVDPASLSVNVNTVSSGLEVPDQGDQDTGDTGDSGDIGGT